MACRAYYVSCECDIDRDRFDKLLDLFATYKNQCVPIVNRTNLTLAYYDNGKVNEDLNKFEFLESILKDELKIESDFSRTSSLRKNDFDEVWASIAPLIIDPSIKKLREFAFFAFNSNNHQLNPIAKQVRTSCSYFEFMTRPDRTVSFYYLEYLENPSLMIAFCNEDVATFDKDVRYNYIVNCKDKIVRIDEYKLPYKYESSLLALKRFNPDVIYTYDVESFDELALMYL